MNYLNLEIPVTNKQQNSKEFKSIIAGFKPVGYVE
jgi:hypothetical protein